MKLQSLSRFPSVVAIAAVAAALLAAPIGAQSAPPLVTAEQALQAGQPAQVAVTVDSASIAERTVDGAEGSVFSATDPAGGRMEVELVGKLPASIQVSPVVVLVGVGREGRFHANRALVPTAAAADPARGLKAVLAVTMVVWVGLFLYVFMLDRRLRRLEE